MNGCQRSTLFIAALWVCLVSPFEAAIAAADDMPEQQDCANAKVAMELGRQVLAIRAALDNPAAPDAMQAIVELGTDWRGYVMVRGWLAEQLRADTSIAAASQGDPPARIAARIEFLERAIRAIDLE